MWTKMNYAGRGINSLENWEVKNTLSLIMKPKKSAVLFSETLNYKAVGVVARNRINFKAKYKTQYTYHFQAKYIHS